MDAVITDLPYTIGTPGRYRLVGDVSLSGTTSHGITIGCNRVELDLGGFSLNGPGGALGSSDGISISGALTDIQIRNGTIRNFNRDGIGGASCDHSVFESLNCKENKRHGMSVRNTNTFRNCRADHNVGSGIVAVNDTRVLDCSADSNTGSGIEVSGGGNEILQNNLRLNATGLNVTSGGNYIERNRARANTTNFNIVSGNTTGAGDNANISF